MKKILLFLSVCMIGIFASCNKEDVEKECSKATKETRDYVFSYTIDSDQYPETRANLLKSRRWKTGETIRIKFLDDNSYNNAQQRVKQVAEEWMKYANLDFKYVDKDETADVKIAFQWNGDHVAWSSIGIDSKKVSQTAPSMNITLFNKYDSNEINSEDFAAVVLREFGHMLGLIFEHQGPKSGLELDEEAVTNYLLSQKWDMKKISTFFSIYKASQTNYTEFDVESIMSYYIPDHLTKNGKGTKWNYALSSTDKAFIRSIYPGKEFSLPNKLDLFYTQDNGANYISYTGVKIGEYYWVDKNFHHKVPGAWENGLPTTQARFETYFPCARLDLSQYKIDIKDFDFYYGLYYTRESVNYMTEKGKMTEGSKKVTANWELPSAADFQQLFAMCPFSKSNTKKELGELDVRFALSGKEHSNPVAINIWDPEGRGYNVYWFDNENNTNMYNFNLMPAGEKLNGPGYWSNNIGTHYGDLGDFQTLFYTVGFYTKESNVRICENIDTKMSYGWHWFNLRWCRKLTDMELGYKLYINNEKTDIKKLNLTDNVPTGYSELPKGYLRGFYVQYILDNPSPKYTVSQIVEFTKKIKDSTIKKQEV